MASYSRLFVGISLTTACILGTNLYAGAPAPRDNTVRHSAPAPIDDRLSADDDFDADELADEDFDHADLIADPVYSMWPKAKTNQSATTSGTLVLAMVTNSTGLAAGASKTYKWNNAPSNRVYAFSAQPYVLAGSTGCATITNVSYYQTGNPQEREVYVTVKNCGSITINFDIWMAQMY